MATKQERQRVLAWLALAFGAIEFVLRALRRTNGSWLSDLAAPYVSTRLWLRGANPYDSLHFLAAWYASGATSLGFSDAVTNVPSVYPPPTLPFIIPFALLRWPDAVHAFILCALLLYGFVVYRLIRLGWPHHTSLRAFMSDPLAIFFLAFALGFAPAHTAINSENIVLFSACAAILAVLILIQSGSHEPETPQRKAASSGRTAISPAAWTAGIAIVASLCIKPTTGIFLLLFLAWERRWKLIVSVLLVSGGIAALSLGPLLAHHNLDWLNSYRANVATLFTNGGNADVSLKNPDRTDHIDLQLVFFAMSQNRSLSSALAAAAYLAILAAFFRRAGWLRPAPVPSTSSPSGLPLLTGASMLALGLIPVYSRIYSAVVLLPLVLWCFLHLNLRPARWLLLLLSDFLLNTSAILRRSAFMQSVAAKAPRLWDATLGGHTCWLLLAIGILLVWAVRDQRRMNLQLTTPN